MANGFRGEASFTHEGKTYTIVFDANALCDVEDALSTPEHRVGMAEIMKLLQTGMSLSTFRAILHGGLRRHHPELGLHDAGDLISDVGFDALGDKVAEAFDKAMPEAPKGTTGGNRKASRGAGKRP